MGSDAGNEPGAGMAGGAFELLTEQCGEDLVGMYEGSVKRVQTALQELRCEFAKPSSHTGQTGVAALPRRLPAGASLTPDARLP